MSNILTDISGLFQKVVAWIKGAEEKLKPVLTIAENVLNALKAFDASAAGQTVESLIEAAIPASTGLINAFKLQLPVWLIKLNWITSEDGKTLDQQWADAQAYLNTLKGGSEYAVQLNSLKALFTEFFGSNGTDVVNIQQALVLAQPSHDITTITGTPVE